MSRCLTRAFTVALLSWAGASAHAETTLTYEWTDISCGVIAVAGSRSAQPCATTSFSALLNPGESVYVSASLSYMYHDDGLALAQTITLRPSPANEIVLNHEAAVIGITSSVCFDFRSCNAQAADHVDNFVGAGPLSPLVFGNNLVPDDLSGQSGFFASSGVPSAYPGGPLQRSVSFDVNVAETYSGVIAAVPEPSTYALMFTGLAALAGATRRRARQRRAWMTAG